MRSGNRYERVRTLDRGLGAWLAPGSGWLGLAGGLVSSYCEDDRDSHDPAEPGVAG
jgi:hypothetical protein